MAVTPEIRENADGTVDLIGVEILSAGGPVHGVGSPPEGDFWTREDLEAIAAANRDLADEVKGPNKLGHSNVQALLENSGIKPVSPGEMPAVGWLDGSTFEVGDRDGVAKLLADIRAVPAKVADLIVKKAYRTRSVELSKVTSQSLTDGATPRVFEWVVTGLAWLGAKMPAVRTLDDIVALYEDQHLAAPEGRAFLIYADGGDGSVAWSPEAGFQDLRDDVGEALNGPPTGGMNEPRFWVYDIALTLDKALVQDYYGDGADGYVIPFTRGDGDKITIAPSSDWTPVEQGWIESAREFEAAVTLRAQRADIRRGMANKTYTAEQRKAFSEATGLAEDKVTDEMLTAAGVASEESAPTRDLEADERIRQLEQDTRDANERSRKLEEDLRVERRDAFVTKALEDGRIEPGQREFVEELYDAKPDKARAFVESLKPNEEFARTFGAEGDDDEATAETRELSDKQTVALMTGVPVEEVV